MAMEQGEGTVRPRTHPPQPFRLTPRCTAIGHASVANHTISSSSTTSGRSVALWIEKMPVEMRFPFPSLRYLGISVWSLDLFSLLVYRTKTEENDMMRWHGSHSVCFTMWAEVSRIQIDAFEPIPGHKTGFTSRRDVSQKGEERYLTRVHLRDIAGDYRKTNEGE